MITPFSFVPHPHPSSLRDYSIPHYSLSTSEITLVHGAVEGHECLKSIECHEYPSPPRPSRVPTTSRVLPRLTSLPRLTLHHSLSFPTALLTLPSPMHPLTISLSASELNLPVQASSRQGGQVGWWYYETWCSTGRVDRPGHPIPEGPRDHSVPIPGLVENSQSLESE